DCTLVTYGAALGAALEAAGILAEQGVSLEILDLRSLVPLDKPRLLASVRKTGRLVVLHDANKFGGFGGEIAAIVAEEAFDCLKSPIRRIGALDIPVPFSPPQEKFNRPSSQIVVETVRAALGRKEK
ncbi:MAG TPA: transketolase C-terminal domain-containing protein, partial [Thermodesulfobacteriota bacterium]|nr:transketolase C-terminal domain-containing protein [Thermodesulfobacteriota bacterium]